MASFKYRFYNGGWSSSWATFNTGSLMKSYVGASSTRTIVQISGLGITDNQKSAKLNLNFYYISTAAATLNYYVYTSQPTLSGTSVPSGYITSGSISLPNTSSQYSSKTAIKTSSFNTTSTTLYVFFTATALIQLTDKGVSGAWTSSYSDIELNYTACTAPTSITMTPKYAVPGASFTISWSGAKAGTNNSISSYRVSYKIGDTASWTTASWTNYDGRAEETSTSHTFTLSSTASRGSTIYVRVETKGKNYNPSTLPSLHIAGSKINYQPAKPSVSVSGTIPSSGGTAKVTVTPGDLGEDDQTGYLFYNTTNSVSSATRFYSPANLQDGTYYFWTMDGYEYSPSESLTLTRNKKPTVSVSDASFESFIALGGGGEETYNSIVRGISWAKSITPIIETSLNKGTIKATVQMYRTDSAPTSYTDWDSGSSYSISQTVSSTSTTLNKIDIQQAVNKAHEDAKLSLQSTSLRWRLKIVYNDGIEDSSPYYYPEEIDNSGVKVDKYFRLPKAPSITTVYNQNGNEDIAETISGHIDQVVKLIFPTDESMDLENTKIYATSKGTNYDCTITSKSQDNSTKNTTIVAQLPKSVPEGNFVLTAELSDANSYLIKKAQKTLTKIAYPKLESFKSTFSKIKPFSVTSNSLGSFSLTYPYIKGKDYGLGNDPKYELQYKLSSSTTWKKAPFGTKTTWSQSNELLQSGNISLNTIYDLSSNPLGINSYVGQHSIDIRLQVTNLYGTKFQSDTTSVLLDFSESIKELKITGIKWAKTAASTSWTDVGDKKIQQGAYLQFSISFTRWTEDNLILSLYPIINGEKQSSVNLNIQASKYPGSNSQSGNKVNTTIIYGPIGEIRDSKNWVWNLSANSDSISTIVTSPTKSTAVAPQYDPQAVIKKAEYNDNKVTLNLELTNDDNNPKTFTLKYGNSSIALASSKSEKVYTLTASPNWGTDWTVKSVSVDIIDSLKASEKTCLFDSIITYPTSDINIYNLSPTVAYRKNHLGINTAQPDDDAILTIYPSSDCKTIRFVNGVGEKIELDLIKPYNGSSYPAITVKKGTTEYTLFFD